MLNINRIHYKIFFLILFSFSFLNTNAQQQPIPDWVKDIGGIGESKVTGVAVDKFDNIYIAGNFRSSIVVDQSGVSTPITLYSTGDYDVFVAKYTPDGKLTWAKSIGGPGLDQVNNLTVDDESNVIFGGQYNSSSMDCDPGAGTFNINNNGGNDAFIVKLDVDGNFKWAKNVGGSGTDFGHVVAADKFGNIVFVGSYYSSINVGSINLFSKGGSDGFAIKYDKNGNAVWAYSFGGPGNDEIKHVVTDSNNEIIIMGYFGNSIDLNPKGPSSMFTGNSSNYFIAKYTEQCQLIWANKVDGPSTVISSLAISPDDNIYLTGAYSGSVIFNSPLSNITLTASSSKNLFIGKYNSTGTSLWAKNIEGTSTTPYSYYITADSDDNVYIGGYFDGTLVFGNAQSSKTLTYHGNRDTFFAKYTGAGDYTWAFNFGSPCSGNFGHKIAVDSKKNILLGGSFCNTVDFNPSTCNLNISAKNAISDGYISKYNQVKFTGDANIVSFELDEQTAPAIIDVQNKTITIKVKSGTNLTTLKPTLSTDIGVLNPLSGVVTNFTQPKEYIISSNCIDYSWLVTVMVENANEISICSGSTQILTGNSINTKPSATYEWQIKDLNGNWVDAPNSNKNADYEIREITNFSDNDITFYFRRKVSVENNNIFEAEKKITIHPATNNNIISSNQTLICNGSADITITGTLPQGASNTTKLLRWQQSDDSINWLDIPNQTNKDLLISISKRNYFRRVTQADNCISYSNTVFVDFQPAVSQSIAGNDISLCDKSNVNLIANSPATNETGSWSVVSPNNYNPFNSTNVNNPKAIINDIPKDVDVILKWTITQNICQITSSSTLKIHNFSPVTLTVPDILNVTEGQSTIISATITQPSNNYTYLWTPNGGLDNPNILSPVAKPNQTTKYHLKVTYGNNCVIEKDVRIILDKTNKVNSCSREYVQLTGDPIIDNDPILQWQVFKLGAWLDVQGANQNNFSFNSNENISENVDIQMYRRVVKVDNLTYFDSKYELSIYPTIQNNIIQTSTSNFCAEIVDLLHIDGNLHTSSANLRLSYFWEKSIDGNIWTKITGEVKKDIDVENLISTTYFRRSITLENCTYLSNPLKITINPKPTFASAGKDISLCGSTTFTLTANKPGNNELGKWSVISQSNYNPFTPANINDPNAVITNIPKDEKLIFRWEILNQNCNTSTYDEIELISYRNIYLQPTNTSYTIDLGKQIKLGIDTDLDSKDEYTVEWTPKIGLDNPYILSPNASPNENTTYTLRVNYGTDCVKTISIPIKVLNAINVPRSFSPNGDGINDFWEIKNISNYQGSKVTVYNRYGSVIYQSTNDYKSWDGSYNGKTLPVGIYYYVISLADKKSTVLTGSITLIR